MNITSPEDIELNYIVQSNLQKIKKRHEIIQMIIYFLNFILYVLTFIFVSMLVHLSFKNPFKNHKIGDLNNYFNDVEESTIIKNNNYDENKNNNFTFLRNLGTLSICKEIRDNLIEFRGLKLSEIFDFNLDKIKIFSLISLCITSLMVAINILNIIIYFIMMYKVGQLIVAENKKDILKKIFKIGKAIEILGLISRFLNVARFVISLILYHYIETSDLDKYDDFLGCKNVKRKFFEKFSTAEKLRKWFYIYLALEIATQGIEKLNQNFGIEPDKYIEPPEPQEMSKKNDIEESSIPI